MFAVIPAAAGFTTRSSGYNVIAALEPPDFLTRTDEVTRSFVPGLASMGDAEFWH
jgi:VanZ family protein